MAFGAGHAASSTMAGLASTSHGPMAGYAGGSFGAGTGSAAAPAATPLLTSLVAYWDLDEASGTRADSHTGGLDLTDNNTVGSGLGVDGVSTAADLVFANGEYLSSASASLRMSDRDFTFGVWIRANSNPGDTRAVASASWQAGGNLAWVLERDAAGDLKWKVSSDGTASDTYAVGATSAATWYLVVLVHNAAGDTAGWSLNGAVLTTTARTTGVYVGTDIFEVGGRVSSTFDGRMQSGFFYDRVLTNDEIAWLYNSGTAARTYAEVAAYTG